jgi:hypothetical protein
MIKKTVWITTVALILGLTIGQAWAQDFRKEYPLGSGGRISISNVSGQISVAGYNGTSVAVSGYREGRDRDQVEIVDESSSGNVTLRVQYPRGGNTSADVRFVVQVPTGYRYQFDSLTTASGDIDVTNVAGDIKVKTASGDVTMNRIQGNVQASSASGDVRVSDVLGMASARTASGDVEVSLTQIDGSGELAFSSASGDVTVKVPAGIGAQVDISTASGSVKSDFSLTYEDREVHGKKAYGKLGSGAVPLKISSASCNVRLIRS